MRRFFPLPCALLLATGTAYGEPYLPKSNDTVLETLPALDLEDGHLPQLQQQLRQQPDNLALALQVANRLITTARSQADPRYYGYAEAALSPWWQLPQPPAQVLLVRATIRQHRHDFAAALADLRVILAEQPAHFQARLTEAVILTVQGDYPAALRSCQWLTQARSHRLLATTCLANVQSLTGQARQAYRYLNDILQNSAAADAEEKRWGLTVLAEIAERMGDFTAAERHFLAALALPQPDVYLLGAYADFLLDRDRPAEAVKLLENNSRPDALLLRLALAEQTLNAEALPAHVAELQARIDAYRQRGDAIHQREEARYALHLLKQPQPALALALANWQVQREPADAHLVLEAALASNKPEVAKPVMDWLKQNQLEDVRLQELTKRLEGL